MDKGHSSCNSFKGNKGLYFTFENRNQIIYTNKINEKNTKSLLVTNQSLNHASKGEFTLLSNKHISGGHGQESINYMDQSGIEYEINIEYNNGVRVGNILNSIDRKMRTGNNHSWFPKEWSESDIKNAANDVLDQHKNLKNGKISGIHKNVEITIIIKNGIIKTIYPNKYQKGGKK